MPRNKRSSKKLGETLQAITRKCSRPLRLFFQDEGRFGRISQLRRCWTPVGIRPIVPAQHIRQYTYTFAAIEPKTGETVSLILPEVTSVTMGIFLKELSSRYPHNDIALVCDGAPWHKGKALEVPDNIHFIPLPPYSPELNPVEQLWKALRGKYFANTLFNSMNTLENKLVQALRWVESNTEWVRSFSLYHWILSAI